MEELTYPKKIIVPKIDSLMIQTCVKNIETYESHFLKIFDNKINNFSPCNLHLFNAVYPYSV